jgi:hypothetical protein
MVTRELPQYAEIESRLKPVLAGLPPKLIVGAERKSSLHRRRSHFDPPE